jgi:hypothetical protein
MPLIEAYTVTYVAPAMYEIAQRAEKITWTFAIVLAVSSSQSLHVVSIQLSTHIHRSPSGIGSSPFQRNGIASGSERKPSLPFCMPEVGTILWL